MRKRSFMVGFWALALIFLTSVTFETLAESAWPDAYKRRNFQLGITLSEFNKIKHPDQKEWPDAFPICSTDKEFTEVNKNGDEYLRGVWHSLGVIKCNHYWKSESFVSRYTPHSNISAEPEFNILGAGLLLGDYRGSSTYYFYSPSDEQTPVLFLIETTGYSQDYESVVELFRMAMGTPTGIDRKHVRNRLGGIFRNDKIYYRNKSSRIELSRYGDSVKRFEIKHILSPVMNRFANKIKAYRLKQSKKL